MGERILIVDDSEIDREILRNILNNEFEVVEASDGYSALNIILKKGEDFDAVLLDVSMPLLDGISVLRILRENNLQDVQIFMITVEATKENIEKASQYNIAEFIKKPFNRNEVLKRIRSKLGVGEQAGLTKTDIDETRKYISDLEFIYNRYLNLSGKNKRQDECRSYFMKVMLEKFSNTEKGKELDDFKIEMISKAAYLCNIGNMLVENISPSIGSEDENKYSDIYQQHTIIGADILRLNYSRHCKRFVEICAEICLHHHERFDGMGFPHGIRGDDNSIYAQICGLLERFEDIFSSYSRKHNAVQFDHVVNQLRSDSGFVSSKVLLLLIESKSEIIRYYNENNI